MDSFNVTVRASTFGVHVCLLVFPAREEGRSRCLILSAHSPLYFFQKHLPHRRVQLYHFFDDIGVLVGRRHWLRAHQKLCSGASRRTSDTDDERRTCSKVGRICTHAELLKTKTFVCWWMGRLLLGVIKKARSMPYSAHACRFSHRATFPRE